MCLRSHDILVSTEIWFPNYRNELNVVEDTSYSFSTGEFFSKTTHEHQVLVI